MSPLCASLLIDRDHISAFPDSAGYPPQGGDCRFCIPFVLDDYGPQHVHRSRFAKPRTRQVARRVQRTTHLVRLCAARPCPLRRVRWRLHAPGRGRPCAASPACQLAPARPARPPPAGAPIASPLRPARVCASAVAALPLLPDQRASPGNVQSPPPSGPSPPQGGTHSGPALRPAGGRLRGSGRGRRCAAPARAAGGSSSRRGRRRAGAARSGQRVTLPGPQGERHPSRRRRRGVRARRYRCRVLLAREPV
jgi:hypothetical protein